MLSLRDYNIFTDFRLKLRADYSLFAWCCFLHFPLMLWKLSPGWSEVLGGSQICARTAICVPEVPCSVEALNNCKTQITWAPKELLSPEGERHRPLKSSSRHKCGTKEPWEYHVCKRLHISATLNPLFFSVANTAKHLICSAPDGCWAKKRNTETLWLSPKCC